MGERDLIQAEVAEMVNTASSTLTRWRRGSKPQRNMLTMLAKALNVDRDWLAKGTGPGRYASDSSSALQDLRPWAGYGVQQSIEEPVFPLPTETPNRTTGVLLGALTTDELLSLIGRIRKWTETFSAVLDEIRRRTGSSPDTGGPVPHGLIPNTSPAPAPDEPNSPPPRGRGTRDTLKASESKRR